MKTFNSFKEFKFCANLFAKEYKFTISKYNKDFSIDVEGPVDMRYKGLKEIPIQFNIVDGNFVCHYNQLTSLKGCPKYVNGSFDCSYNELTSLKGCPRIVNRNLFSFEGKLQCREYNKFISLEGAPEFIGNEWFIKDQFKSFPEYQRYLLVKKIEAL